MIMRKLTPDLALLEYIAGREVYIVKRMEPSTTVEELAAGDGYVVFEETPDPRPEPETATQANDAEQAGETPAGTADALETPETGRPEATAEPEAETVAESTSNNKTLNHAVIYSQYKGGKPVQAIAKEYKVTEAAIWYHIRRAIETGGKA